MIGGVKFGKKYAGVRALHIFLVPNLHTFLKTMQVQTCILLGKVMQVWSRIMQGPAAYFLSKGVPEALESLAFGQLHTFSRVFFIYYKILKEKKVYNIGKMLEKKSRDKKYAAAYF